MKVVIADAGPLIGLARIDQVALLAGLFGKVWITEVIAAEIGLGSAATGTPAYPGVELLQEPLSRAGCRSHQLWRRALIHTGRSTPGWMQEKPVRLAWP